MRRGEDKRLRPFDSWRIRDVTEFLYSWDGDVDNKVCESLFLNIIADATQGYIFAKIMFDEKIHEKVFQTGESLVHHIVMRGNWPVLEMYLKYKPNLLQTDDDGNSPLHCLCGMRPEEFSVNYQRCLKLLLAHGGIDLNARNDCDLTPVDLSINADNIEALKTVLASGRVLYLDESSNHHVSQRQRLLSKFPNLENQLPPEKKKIFATSLLPQLLKEKKDNGFAKFFLDLCDREDSYEYLNVNKNDFLREACRNNMFKTVKLLLNFGANPIAVDKQSNQSAITITYNDKNMELLALLLEKSEFPLNSMKIDINQTDVAGNTVLHYASLHKFKKAMEFILKAGGYLGTDNFKKVTPLSNIPQNVLKNYLDECLKPEKNATTNIDGISFMFDFLKRPQKPTETGENYPDLKLLNEMTELDELRPLLTHPVMSAFILLKWQKMKSIFALSLLFHTLLTLLFTFSAYWLSVGNFEAPSEIRCAQTVFLILLFFRHQFLAIIAPKHYIKNFENFLGLGILLTGGYSVLNESSDPDLCCYLEPVVVFLSWIQFFIMIQKHPKCSIHVTTTFYVLFHSLKYLSLFLITYTALGFSFFVLFKECNDACYFQDAARFGQKITAKLFNIFATHDIVFEFYPAASLFFFFTFLFKGVAAFISLVYGLVEHDSRLKKLTAVLNLRVSQIKYLASLEEVLQKLQKLPYVSCVFKCLVSFEGKVNSEDFRGEESRFCCCKFDESVLEDAREIVARKMQPN